jgi:hypothetical protein
LGQRDAPAVGVVEVRVEVQPARGHRRAV